MKFIRTALFAPGSNKRVMQKALASGSDAVILDLEDSVSLADKETARHQVAQTIQEAVTTMGVKKPIIIVRVNATETGLLHDDVKAVAIDGLDLIMLPKAETIEEIKVLSKWLDEIESKNSNNRVELALQIETALGIYRCFELIKASNRVSMTCIGSARDGDLQNDLGCGWSIEGTELLYARSKMLLDTRAAGNVLPLDGVFSDLGDDAGFLKDSMLSASLGYVGRTIIHPKQMDAVQDAYGVNARDVAYYKRVVKEFEEAEKLGIAAITIDSKLIDYAMYKQAKRILEISALEG
jgi:citrate lyase subunit beta/citryl-CoA lyase